MFCEEMVKVEQNYYEKQCLWFNKTKYLLKDLEKKAFQLAILFREQGIEHKKEQKVLIMLRRSPALFVAHYATFLAGGVIVSIDPDTPEDRLHTIIEETNPNVILVHTNQSLNDKSKIIYLDDELEMLDGSDAFQLSGNENFSLNAAAYIVFTSGTTGKPKGVIVEWKSLMKLIEWHTKTFQVGSDSIVSLTASPGFDASIWEIWSAIGAKASIHITSDAQRLLPNELQKEWAIHKVTHSFVSTPIAERLLDLPWKNHETTLKHMLVGGDKLTKFPLDSVPFNLVNNYGPSEATVVSTSGTIQPKRDGGNEFPHIGKPLPYMDCFILDEHGNEISEVGEQGTLWLSGVALARGYLNTKIETDKKFRKIKVRGELIRAYNTGDIVSKGKDGNFYFHGRKDFQVSINGVRIELGEIEKVLQTHAKVLHAIVLPIEFHSKKLIVASVVLEKNSMFIEEEIKAYISKKLTKSLVPIQILYHDQIPLTDNGKIDRKRLTVLHEEHLQNKQNLKNNTYLEDVNDSMMTQITNVYSDVLQIQCYPNTDIFEMGGNSMDAARIAATLSNLFRVKCSPHFIQKVRTPINVYHQIRKPLQNTIGGQRKESPVINRDEWIRVTSMKKGLWYLWKTNENNTFYNIGATFHLKDTIDIPLLSEIIVTIIEREPTFSTIFRENARGEIERKYQRKFDTTEWFYQMKVDSKEEALIHANSIYNTNFDLEKDLLIRGALIQTNNDGTVFVLATHHIVCDGLSLQKILRDISTAYNNRSLNTSTKENIYSTEYIASSEEQLSTYWKEKAGQFHLAQVSMKENAESLLAKGEIYECKSRLSVGKSIDQLAKKHKISKFIILLTGWAINLTKYFRQETVTIGIPYHGRGDIDFSKVGMFVNLIPVTITISKEKTFIDLLTEVNELMQEHMEHGDFSIVDIASLTENRKQFDIVNNTFSEKIHLDVELGNKRAEFIEQDTGGARFPISGFFHVQDEEIEGHVEFSYANFDTSEIKLLTDSYFNLMDSLVRYPDQQWQSAFKKTSVIEAQEYYNLMKESKPLHQLFEDSVAKHKDFIAVEDHTSAFTYGELNQHANRFASLLHSKGIRKGDYVPVFMVRNKELLVVILGILKIGAIYVPLDVEHPKERIKNILNRIEPRVLISNKKVDYISTGRWELIYTNDMETCQQLPIFKMEHIKTEDPAYLMFTSGSTGNPKGVLCPHLGASLRVLWQKNQQHLKPNNRILFKTPYTFDVSIWEIFYTLSVGATLVIGANDLHKDPEKIYEFIKNKSINYCHFVPSVFQRVLDYFEELSTDTLSLKYLHLSGEALSKQLAKKIQEILPNTNILNLYGPTETGIEVTVQEVSNGNYNIGKPLPYVSLQVIDEDVNPVPIGYPGELLIGGPSLALGYFKDENETQKSFIIKDSQRFYKTGDLVRITSNGSIDFLGRKDDQVKVNGIRIETEEIERCVMNLANVKDATVVLAEGMREKQLVCFYTSVNEHEANDIEVKKQVSNNLPVSYIPSVFIELSDLPITQNGKRDRKRLGEMAYEYLNKKVESNFIEAKTELQKSIVKVWSDVLKINRVGLGDNFFELGGDSIKSLQIVSKLRAEGVNLTPRDFLKYPTILELTAILK